MRIEAPVKEPGTVIGVGGLEFVDGVAETDNPAIVSYCVGAGYQVGGEVIVPPVEADPVDPRDLGTDGDGIEQLGTPLRDAAVAPEPGDFLAPTNAGQANPHGPDVVSPEVHASQGVRSVRGGPVATDDAGAQDGAEKAHTVDPSPPEVDADDTTVAGDPPGVSANKAAWVAYAVASGLDEVTAEAMTKAELVDAYGAKG